MRVEKLLKYKSDSNMNHNWCPLTRPQEPEKRLRETIRNTVQLKSAGIL